MNRIISWKEWEKEIENRQAWENLKNSKSGSIAFIKDKDIWTRWDIYHAHWETYLASNYWKNWQEKINSFQTEKEVDFYTSRLRAFIDFVKDSTQKDIHVVRNAKSWDPKTTPELIEQELKRLENISEEEFNKADKWRNSVKWRELSAQEALNDPWFSKQIDNLFGLGNKNQLQEKENSVKKVSDNSTNYNNWTKNKLITEINRLKTEIESLKNNRTITSSEQQARLQYNQQKLNQIQSVFNLKDTQYSANNNSLTPLLIGGTLLSLIALISFLVIRKHRKNK